jgi:GLPGLI family protein
MTVIDSGYIRIWYALNALDIHKPETYDDMQRLEIGAGISKYFSHFVYNNDSLITDWGEKNRNARSAPIWMGMKCKNDGWSEYSYSEYFKDFGKNTFTEYARMPWGGVPNYQYTEIMPAQIWEMQADTLTIAGFFCQKATCTFRGRSYTAWFARDIPIPNGPWKFGGLPGLILKVYDNSKMCQFECIRIENRKQKYPIKRHDYRNYGKTGRKEVLKLQKELHEDYGKVAGIIFETPPPRNETPYRPLELE